MNSSDPSIAVWIERARAGNAEAQQELWDRFFPQLLRLAKSRLQRAPQRLGDEEDVALSVFQSFFRGIQENRFPSLRGEGDLWRLLSSMTHRKAIDWLRHANRQKRMALGESALLSPDQGERSQQTRPMSQVEGKPQSPLLELVVIEEVRRLMDLLTDDLRGVAVKKLEHHTNAEIAAALNCSVATVERRLKLIRQIWSEPESHA